MQSQAQFIPAACSTAVSPPAKILMGMIWEFGAIPQIGKPTDDQKARIKVVKDFLLIYEDTVDSIIILTIWDSRQDPEKLEKILK